MPCPGGWILVSWKKARNISRKVEFRPKIYILLKAIVYYKNNYHKHLKYIIRVDNIPIRLITMKRSENEPQVVMYKKFTGTATPGVIKVMKPYRRAGTRGTF